MPGSAAFARARVTPAALAVSLVLAGCTASRPVQPVETPAVPMPATPDAPPADVRATILGGEAPVPVPPGAVRTDPKAGDITLNFPSADVRVVAQAVLGDVLRLRYSVAPGLTTPVSLVTPGPVARESILPLFESALRNAGLALVPFGEGFEIQAVQTAQARGPVDPGVTGFGTELIRLEFINADELKRLIDSVLPNVVQSADASANTLTIAGTTGQRQSARDLIRQFDVNWLRNMTFAMFVPQRTDARLIVPELEKLINAADAPTRGLVRLISMERLNGILAISRQAQYLEDVRRWVEILDREGENSEPRLFVYRVQNGRARDLARTINNAFGTGGGDAGVSAAGPEGQLGSAPGANGDDRGSAGRADADAQSPRDGSGSARSGGVLAEDNLRISADETNNAIIVFGTPREFAVVEQALRQLDILPYQVLIEAAITEVSLTDDLRYGVQWNFITGDSNFSLTEGSTAGTVTRLAPGFSYFFSGDDISAALNALERRTNLKVVSAPKVLVLNNQTAALQVGDQVPILSQQVTSTDGDSTPPVINSVEYRDTGVILRVTPRVNAGGLVLLDIAQEVSDVTSTSSSSINSPTISTRRISTSIAVQDRQVIALGGLFRDSKSFGKNGLPLLSRIPVLGSLLFGNSSDTQRRTELIVLLKPTVVRSVDDGRAITEELRAKIRTLEPFRTEGRIP